MLRKIFWIIFIALALNWIYFPMKDLRLFIIASIPITFILLHNVFLFKPNIKELFLIPFLASLMLFDGAVMFSYIEWNLIHLFVIYGYYLFIMIAIFGFEFILMNQDRIDEHLKRILKRR